MTAPDTHERLHRLAVRLGRLAFDAGLPAEPARDALLLCCLVWGVMALQVSSWRLARAGRAVGRLRLPDGPTVPARLTALREALDGHRERRAAVLDAAARLSGRRGAAGRLGRLILNAVGAAE